MAEYIRKDVFTRVYMEKGKDKLRLATVINELEMLPAADVAPVVHSRWEECDYVEPRVHGFGTNRIKDAGMKCLNCVHVFKKDLLWKDNFFPNCGAKMDLRGENSNGSEKA